MSHDECRVCGSDKIVNCFDGRCKECLMSAGFYYSRKMESWMKNGYNKIKISESSKKILTRFDLLDLD